MVKDDGGGLAENRRWVYLENGNVEQGKRRWKTEEKEDGKQLEKRGKNK